MSSINDKSDHQHVPSTETYQEKIVISGNIIEHYHYQKPIIIRRPSKNDVIPSGRCKVASPDVVARNRKKSANKARNSIRRLSHCNAGMYKDCDGNVMKPVFVTLTFRDILSPKQVTKEFKTSL
ncbi:hypothetical protein N752_25145 [Desulforamulus aquiferis]|nr:hypothetical protein N752_25145 [Desulforamulus aquiferis]